MSSWQQIVYLPILMEINVLSVKEISLLTLKVLVSSCLLTVNKSIVQATVLYVLKDLDLMLLHLQLIHV